MSKLGAVYLLIAILMALGIGCCFYIWSVDNKEIQRDDEDLFKQ